MAVRIRLQRFGRKRTPYYHIVVADSRSPRDGKFIERIGSYNPNTNPATIDVDSNKAIDWLNKGAQPTDTARAILSYKGVMFLKHLQRGVRKNILTQEDADKKFADWLEVKEGKVAAKVGKLKSTSDKVAATRHAAETEIAKAKANMLMAKKQAELDGIAKAAAAETASQAPVVEDVVEATPEAVVVEAPVEVTPEAVVEAPVEVVAETPAVIEKAPVVEEVVAETAPVAEAPAEETTAPAAEESTETPAE